MTNKFPARLTLVLIATLVYSCQGIGGSPAIQVWLDQPLDGMEFEVNETVRILAHARDANGPGITEVRIYIDGNLSEQISTDSTLPLVNADSEYKFAEPGTYTIEVKAMSSSGVVSQASIARIRVNGEAVAQVLTRTPTRRATTPTPTPTRRVTPTPTTTRRVITPTRTPLPSISTRPVITSVTGPATIINNNQRNYFNVSFSDGDGNINRVAVNSPQAYWANLDYNPLDKLVSGNKFSGTFTFFYFCSPTGTLGGDTLIIVLYDAQGNASDPYSFTLSCTSASGAETGGNPPSSGGRDVTGTFASSTTQLNAPGPSVAFNWNTAANGKFKYSLVLEIRPVTGQYSEKQLANSVEQHSGATVEFPSATTNYTLRAFFNDANEKPTSKVIGSITVTVGSTPIAPQAGATPFLTLTADSTSLQAGQCTTLRWASGNIQSIFLNGEGVTGNENRQVCPSQTTTYTLIANASNGGLQRQITVTVSGAPAVIIPSAHTSNLVSISVSGGHGSTHHIGESVQVCYFVDQNGDSVGWEVRYYPGATSTTSGPSGSNTLIASGGPDAVSTCKNITLSGPTGLAGFQVTASYQSGTFAEADIWINSTP